MSVDYEKINGALEKMDEVEEKLPLAKDKLNTDILYSDSCNFDQAKAKIDQYLTELRSLREKLESDVKKMKTIDNEIEGRSWLL